SPSARSARRFKMPTSVVSERKRADPSARRIMEPPTCADWSGELAPQLPPEPANVASLLIGYRTVVMLKIRPSNETPRLDTPIENPWRQALRQNALVPSAYRQ